MTVSVTPSNHHMTVSVTLSPPHDSQCHTVTLSPPHDGQCHTVKPPLDGDLPPVVHPGHLPVRRECGQQGARAHAGGGDGDEDYRDDEWGWWG